MPLPFQYLLSPRVLHHWPLIQIFFQSLPSDFPVLPLINRTTVLPPPTFSDPLDFSYLQFKHFLSLSSLRLFLLLLPSLQFQFQIQQHSSIQPMAVSRFSVLLLCFFLSSLLVNITASTDSPAPAPDSSADSPPSSHSHSPSPSPSNVVPAPNPSPASSPESPTPAAAPPHPDSPPSPSPENFPSPSPSPSPSPYPDEADNDVVNHTGVGDEDGKSSGGGMSSGKKAGIAVGVIVGAGVVAMGAFVYKKRRQNIQRSEYGYAARRELL